IGLFNALLVNLRISASSSTRRSLCFFFEGLGLIYFSQRVHSRSLYLCARKPSDGTSYPKQPPVRFAFDVPRSFPWSCDCLSCYSNPNPRAFLAGFTRDASSCRARTCSGIRISRVDSSRQLLQFPRSGAESSGPARACVRGAPPTLRCSVGGRWVSAGRHQPRRSCPKRWSRALPGAEED